MGEYLESVMMIAFILAVGLGMYKFYILFEKQAADGIDIDTLEKEIIAIIEDLFDKEKYEKDELFGKIRTHEKFDSERHKNFNLNRFRKVLERLYMRHNVENYEELKEKM